MVSRSRETGTDDGLLTPVHNRFTHRPRGCSWSRIPGGCQAVPHAPPAGKRRLGQGCRGRRRPQGGDANAAPSKAPRANGQAGFGWPVGSVGDPRACQTACAGGTAACAAGWTGSAAAHRNRDEGPVFDDQARAMSLRGAWSLRTLPTTRHRCRCVFSQATATSMPPRFSRSEFQPWTRRSRSSPLHRRRSSGSSSKPQS